MKQSSAHKITIAAACICAFFVISPFSHAAEETESPLDKLIETARQTGSVENPDEAVNVIQAAKASLDTAKFLEKLDALQQARKDCALPAPGKPLSRNQKLDWAILAEQVKAQKNLPAEQVKAHPAAAAFPGAVSDDAKRVTKPVEIRTDRPGWRNYGIYAASWSKDWHSTGLYAAPGEVVTVTVPEQAVNTGLTIRIGAHSDHLWKKDRLQRAQQICRKFDVKQAVTKVANAFGGPIYIEAPHDCPLGTFNITIANAVEMPRYIAGKTTAEQWQKIRNNPAPWAELETDKVVFTLPSEHVRKLDDPAELMTFWDGVMNACADLLGKEHNRIRPERFVTDIQISVGYMHSGYPLMTGLDIASTFVDKDRIMRNGHAGVWGLFHEIGHNHQNALWVYRGTTEVTVNLFSLYVFEKMCSLGPADNIHGGVLPKNRERSLARYFQNGRKFETWQKDPFLALYMYSMIQEEFGWEPFTDVFKAYRAAKQSDLPKNDNQKRDQWMVRLSARLGRNLGPYFEAWGVPTSETARQSIAQLPVWMPTDFPAAKATDK